jgi:hypothetical protein
MIANLFSPFSTATLVNLGGQNSNALHWEYITKPIFIDRQDDRRNSRTEEYYDRLKEAITADIQDSKGIEPSFYALIIHSFEKTHLSLVDM